jgi:co-chaperonin GroES (HSP10)
MGIEVCGHRVLLKPLFVEEETEWGFKLDVGENFKREKAAAVMGTVIAIGPTAWKAFDGGDKDWKPWAKVGDKVHFAKYGGKFITIDKEEYVIVNDEDIQAVIKED